ncbi:MAG: hypothetical protein AAF845_11270 [Bacteroidota bacterium]
MRVLLLLSLLLVAGCSSIRSGLEIDPGATFVLGGDQRGAFRVQILNTGPAAVRVSEVTVFQDTTDIALIRPGDSAEAHFSEGSAALIANLDGQEASLDVRITGDTNLGMGYTEADE